MADSSGEGTTCPRDSPSPHPYPSSPVYQEDTQRKLDEALNTIKVKDDEIAHLTNLLDSMKLQLDSYKAEIAAAKKEIFKEKLGFNCAKITIEFQAEALKMAKKAREESLKQCVCPKAMSAEQDKRRWESILRSKDYQVERLKKEISTKDATILELQKESSTPPPKKTRRQTNNIWQATPPEETSPVVSPSKSVECVELEDDEIEEMADMSKNSCDFVDELLQDSYPTAMDQNSDSDVDDDDSEDNSDPDYEPNPNWYRNKIVKSLKGKRKGKGRPVKSTKAKRTSSTTTTANGIFECPLCPLRGDGTRLIYANVTGLNYHMSKNHPDHPGVNTDRFQCSDCSEIFVRKADLLKHLRTAHMEVRYKCKYCPKSYSSSHYCTHHEKLHEKTGGGPAVLICGKCSKVFTSELGLHQHLVIRHPHGGGQYKCKHCNASFKHLKALRLHITINHRSKPLKCPHCPKTYTKRGGLRKHILGHSTAAAVAGGSNDVKPDVSGVGRVGGGLRHSIEAKRQLMEHLESKGFSQSQELGNNNSMSSVMSELIPGVVSEVTLDGADETRCEYCGMEFGQSRQLKIHLSRHAFKCIRCLDVFDQASSLRYHLSKTHKIDGEQAEELVRKGAQPIESQNAGTKTEPTVVDDDIDLDDILN